MNQTGPAGVADAPCEIPAHVDPALVVDFDYRQPEGIEEGDVYRAYARLHRGPDIAWTPRHGGHWIAMRAEDIKWIQESWELFSNTEKSVPKGQMPGEMARRMQCGEGPFGLVDGGAVA